MRLDPRISRGRRDTAMKSRPVRAAAAPPIARKKLDQESVIAIMV
jgi:hypothetical protein